MEDFLREKKRKDDQLKQVVDWEKRKTWWLGKISDLYKQVEEWFAPLVPEVVHLERGTMDVYEERLGSYQAAYLNLNLYYEVVKLIPIGTIIIGGLGRVDLIGEEGSINIVLEHKGHRPQIKFYIGKEEIAKSKEEPKPTAYDQMETEWIVPTETRRPKKYKVLTKEVFFDSLKKVMSK